MVRLLLLTCVILLSAFRGSSQAFEVIGLQEVYRGGLGETIKAPVRFKNNSDKVLTLIIRKVSNQIGSSQVNYFCIDNNCLDQKVEDIIVKLEPNSVLNTLQVALEAGLAHGMSAVKYVAFNKSSPGELHEFELNFAVEERAERSNIFSSDLIVVHDVYPNPATEFAFIEYSLLNDKVKAKVVLHNILGNSIEEYALPLGESKVKMRTESLNAGIYFYTIYINNEGLVTRKLIVRK